MCVTFVIMNAPEKLDRRKQQIILFLIRLHRERLKVYLKVLFSNILNLNGTHSPPSFPVCTLIDADHLNTSEVFPVSIYALLPEKCN